MRRRTFDAITTIVGFVMTAVLIVAGVLLMWGFSYSNNTVHNQLQAQQIYFPPKGSPALAPAQIGPYLNQYAGQLMTTGAQAEAYANHFIAVHLQEIGAGKTYSQLSTQLMSVENSGKTDAKLASQVQTVFQGTTLRGLLLNAYGWWQIGQIALIAGICSFVFAGLMLVLSVLGLLHWRKSEQAAEI
jgi:hypothetical protein